MIGKVLLDRIADNPYQTRLAYDDAAIAELADNIYSLRASRSDTLGLIQVPLGRILLGDKILNPHEYGGVGPCLGDEPDAVVQLAAGHSRKRAFQYLADRHGDGYNAMPVDVTVLDDQAMSDIAWSENAKRKDLSAIEEAQAIQRAMDEFGYSLRKVAERWGMSQSAASNKVRLLQLPDKVQALVQSGELPERHARELLPLIQIGQQPDKALKLARQTVKQNTSATILHAQVDKVLKDITRVIPPEMLEWDDWGWLGQELECERICRGCAAESRGRCSQPRLFARKHDRWIKRLRELASEKAGRDSVSTHAMRVDLATLQHAQKTGCANLAVAYQPYSGSGVLVDEKIPDVYHVCSQGYGCHCKKEMKEKTREAEVEADPRQSEYNAWVESQNVRAKEIGQDMVEYLTDCFASALEWVPKDELGMFVALLKHVDSRVQVQYDLDSIAAAMAEFLSQRRKTNHREGEALVYRARVYHLARLLSPIAEVEAQIQLLKDKIREAELRDRAPIGWQVERAIRRSCEILDAHPSHHQELRDELARLEAVIEEFSQEKEGNDG